MGLSRYPPPLYLRKFSIIYVLRKNNDLYLLLFLPSNTT